MAGYLWQLRRSLIALLRSRLGEKLQIEKHDDIVIARSDNSIISAYQAKHGLLPTGITVHSAEWWKTLRIWLGLIASNKLSSESELVFSTSAKVDTSLLPLTKAIKDPEQLKKVMAQHDQVAKQKGNKDLKKAYEKWESAPTKDRLELLARISIEDAQPKLAASATELETELRHHAFREGKSLSVIRQRVVGWFESEVDKRLTTTGCEITYSELNGFLIELQSEFAPGSLPCLYSEAPVPSLKSELEKDPTYLRQLSLLGADDESLAIAVAMFHRASAEREFWLNDHITAVGTLGNYDSDLKNTWLQKKSEASTLHKAKNEVERGWVVFHGCMGYRGAVGAHGSPTHVANGTFHILANGPEYSPAIGWHPQYVVLLGNTS